MVIRFLRGAIGALHKTFNTDPVTLRPYERVASAALVGLGAALMGALIATSAYALAGFVFSWE